MLTLFTGKAIGAINNRTFLFEDTTGRTLGAAFRSEDEGTLFLEWVDTNHDLSSLSSTEVEQLQNEWIAANPT